MTMMRLLPGFLAATAALLLLTARPASADPYGYSVFIPNFSEGATLTISFDGVDSDADGLITGTYGNFGGTPVPQEITSLALAFSGNSLIPAFTLATSDFTSTSASLIFPATPTFTNGSYGFELLYVLDSAGTWASVPDGPPNAANGDAVLMLQGLAGDSEVLIYGTNCGGFGGIGIFGPGTCAGLQYGTADVSHTDFALYDVPEPASMLLLAPALGLLAIRRRRPRAPIHSA